MTDTLYDGRRFRTLNVLDEGNREGLTIDVGMSLPSVRVIAVLDDLIALRGAPRALCVDYGPEVTAISLTRCDVPPEKLIRSEVEELLRVGALPPFGGTTMKRSKYSEEQITYAIRLAESGTPLGDVCRQLGISEATIYVWKKRYAHLGVSELRRLRQLEEENARLKGLVADLTLDKHILQETIRKNR